MAHSPRPGAPVTIAQVGMHAGVSRQTVSSVLNAPHQVDAETRQRVLASIEALRYRPDRAARNAVTRPTGLVGYAMPAAMAPTAFMDQFLRALTGALEASGRRLMLFTAPDGTDGPAVYEELLAQRAVDAFVLTDTSDNDPRHLWLAERDVRFVSFGRTWPTHGSQPGLWVDVDGAAACARLVAGLYQLGHRRIGFVTWDRTTGAMLDRIAGWRTGCGRHGLSTGDDLVVRVAENSIEAGTAAARALLDSADPPTAIMAVSDTLAVGVLGELRRRGLAFGSDVAVTGFDDSEAASVVEGGLTTVRQPVEQIAGTLVELLDTSDYHRGVLLAGEVVNRGSAPLGGAPGPARGR